MKAAMYYQDSPYITWQSDFPADHRLYICQIREGRSKARVPAVFEALSLLAYYQPVALLSGPLGSQKGIFWMAIAPDYQALAEAEFRFLGYTHLVYRLDAPDDESDVVRWRGTDWSLTPVYREDAEVMREKAPDKRVFMLRGKDGPFPVRGYRGDGTALGRRGLAVEDARLLVNLALPAGDKPVKFLDPFGGIGGLVVEAVERGFSVFSGDIDPVVAEGLWHFGARHSVIDAAHLPYPADYFDGIASELPFHDEARAVTEAFMPEAWRVLKPGGRVALMGVDWQRPILEQAAQTCGFIPLLMDDILRKGTPVCVGVWQKPAIFS